MIPPRSRCLLIATTWTAALVLTVTPALAAPPLGVEQLEVQYDVLKSDKDLEVAQAQALAAEIVRSFIEADADQQEELVDLAGGLAKLDRGSEFDRLSIKTLAAMGHLRGAKYLKRYLRMKGREDSRDIFKIAIRASAKMPDAVLVRPLLKAFERSKVMSVRVMACEALGHFGKVKRYRVRIMKSLISVLKKDRPSRGYRANQRADLSQGRRAGNGGGEVWAMLSGRMPRTLNLLTGQSIQSMDAWFDVYAGNKRNARKLFTLRTDDEEDS